jgi:CBS domain-containing protein
MVDIDFTHPPLTLLDDQGRAWVEKGVDLSYYDQGTIILDAGQPGEFVFIIHKGEVAELDITLQGDQARIGHYTGGDLFGAISIINGTSRYRFQAEQESLCYLLPKALFERLCEHYPAFAEFFRQRLASKSRLLAERRSANGVSMAGFMLARIAECMRAPVILDETTTLAQAAAALNDSHADSLLIRAAGRFGMITKTDLLNALVLQGLDKASPALGVAHFELVAARPEDYLFQALVSMTRHEVARVVVLEGEQPVGVAELADVLSYFSSRSHVVSLEIEQAEDIPALTQASARLPELVRTLMVQGIKVPFIMDLLAALNGRIVSKAFDFLVAPARRHQSCLLVMGSEGRGEQILKTDQDNALILADAADWPQCAEAMGQLTETLLALGYPRCPGDIMVSNPAWVKSETQWREAVSRWAEQRDGPALMNLAILLDAQGVAGNRQLLEGLREHLFERCARDELLLSHFARAALSFSTPLTLFGSLKRPQHGIDIKKGGIFPIVHGVRTLALERRVTPTSTLSRLAVLAEQGRLEKPFAEDLGEALALFAELRLKQQLMHLERPDTGTDANRVVVQTLSTLERDLLREALHLVKLFKQRLSHRFHLEY